MRRMSVVAVWPPGATGLGMPELRRCLCEFCRSLGVWFEVCILKLPYLLAM